MAAYLQRLLDTAAPSRAGPIGLMPVVRSSSPVFEQNQLLGLEEQVTTPTDASPAEPPDRGWSEPLQFPVPRASGPPGEPPGPPAIAARPSPGAPPAGLAEGPPAPALGQHVPPAQGQAPAPAPAVEAPLEPPRKLTESRYPSPAPIELPPSAPARPSAVAAESAQAAQPAPPASPRRQSRAVAEPVDAGRRGESLPRPAVEREELEAHVPPARLNDIPATDPSIASDPEPEQPRIELSARPPPHPVPTTDPSAAPGRGPEQPRIELSPRPPPDPVPPDAHWEAQAGPAQPVQPTITIGQVRVEIVEDSRPAPAGARPLTAGSASVIGPLGQAQAARRLIALRRL